MKQKRKRSCRAFPLIKAVKHMMLQMNKALYQNSMLMLHMKKNMKQI